MNTAEERHTDQVATLPGFFGRYIRVFTAPDILFQGFRSRPDWCSCPQVGSTRSASFRADPGPG